MKVIGTSAKSGDGIDAVFDDMLKRMNKGGKSEFFKEKARERGATISLTPNNIPGEKEGAKGKNGKKKKKCC